MRKRRNLGQPSDIAFLLIIFFLLLSGIASSQSIPLSLASQSNQTSNEQMQRTLSLASDGTISTEGEQLTTVALRQFIAPAPHVVIAIEAATPWQYVVDLFSYIEQQSTASFSLELVP
ncbi:MAG: biopolymer transporter ExbD [Sphaerochaetaceae bacterium]